MLRGERIRLSLDVIATSAILAASIVLIWTVSMGGRVASTQPLPAQQFGEVLTGLDTKVAPTTLAGDRARIAMIEFSDFQCPFCAQYAREIYPHLESEFIKAGLVTYVFRHFPLANHANAFAASEAAECAARQGQYSVMRGNLFANQHALSPPHLLDYAAASGLNRAAFQQCLDDGLAKAQVQADMAEGERLGVTSTPTFFIGSIRRDGTIALSRRMRGAFPYHLLRAQLQKLM